MEEDMKNLKISDWLIMFLLMSIPIVNFIMLLVWAFGSEANPVRKVFAKASLIWFLILVGLWIILAFLFGVGMFSYFMQHQDALILLL